MFNVKTTPKIPDLNGLSEEFDIYLRNGSKSTLSWKTYKNFDKISQKYILDAIITKVSRISGPTGIETYRRQLRQPIRGLWSGAIDYSQFVEGMASAIERGLERAWVQGGASCGISRNELTQEEFIAMGKLINGEMNYVESLGQDILDTPDLKLLTLYDRVESWVNRFTDSFNRGMLMACQNQKLEWVRGPTKQPCSTCRKLSGKVKRASYWNEMGIYPQAPPNAFLECGGWKCLCSFRVTTKPISRWRLF